MTILVLAAHADDETWGCGGTLAAWSGQGSRVHVVLVTLPDIDRIRARRESEFEQACTILSVTPHVLRRGVYDGQLSHVVTEMIERLDRVCAELAPSVILAPCASSHADHRALREIAIALARPHRYSGSLLFYQAGFEKQDDGPCVYVDTSDVIVRQLKRHALLCYESQIATKSLDPLAVEAVDRVNGLRCGKPMAEVFVPYRMVWEMT